MTVTLLEQSFLVGLSAWLLFYKKKYLLGLIIILDTVILFFTGTRGTMLGLAGGALLTVFLMAILQKSRRIRMIAVGCLAAIIVIAGVLWAARGAEFVHRVGFLDRLASISLTDATIKARFLNMHIALQGVKERPILGRGQENTRSCSINIMTRLRMYGQEPWFDRVHDVVFDWLIAGGIVGLLAYSRSSRLRSTVCGARRASRSVITAFRYSKPVLLPDSWAAYFFHNLTVFDNITS